MDSNAQNQRERRLAYRWPVWCSEDATQAVFLGLMEDVSSGGIAFTCAADQGHFQQGQRLTVRFSLPQFDGEDPEATIGVTRTGCVRSTAPAEAGACRVGLQFDTPLSLKPAEEVALATLCHKRES